MTDKTKPDVEPSTAPPKTEQVQRVQVETKPEPEQAHQIEDPAVSLVGEHQGPVEQVHAPAKDVQVVDPSQPVGNWGVYPVTGEAK